MMPPRQTAELVATLADAVHAAHKAGVIHRDLKPANTLFTDDGVAKQTDSDQDGPTHSGQILGAPVYMAPEQTRGA